MVGVKFGDHVRGIGIILQIPLVSAPAVVAPVLPVLHDEIHRNAVGAELARGGQHLRLAGIPFAALPETIRRLGKQRRVTGGLTIAGNNFIRGRTVEKVVVNRIADFGTERRRVAQRTGKDFCPFLPPPEQIHGTRRVRRQRQFSR